MSTYQVIARKWRPQTFDDVVGQDHVVRTLRNAIARQRIGHAYLFVGPRGTGKTSLARIFAKALNCTGGPRADFPPDDPAVQAIAEGSHLDVIEIDGASNNGVEQVRDLRDTARYAPAQGKFKIYIIDEVHMLSAAAFNALLKTLEEPPAHVKFVFATTDVQKVLPTILSRCQRFDLRPIPPELIVGRLRSIAEAEKIKVSDGALACIARLADGGMRDAQSILDQMISFCGSEIAEPDVLDVYGLVAAEKVAELAGALAAGDDRKIVGLVDECDANGRDLVRLLSDLQALVREVLLDSIAQGGRSVRFGPALTTEQLTRMLDALREGEGGVKLGLAEKINFEVALLKAVEASRARAIDSLIKELTALAGETAEAGAGEKKDLIDRLEASLAAVPAETGRGTSATNRAVSGAAALELEDELIPLATESSEEWAQSAKVEPAGRVESGGHVLTPDSSVRSQHVTPSADLDESMASASGAAAMSSDLPPLEELVARIPAEVRAALDELFRARFTRVTRAALKEIP